MRRSSADENDFGDDSFLDVVANVVGVLIILVMLIGARATHSLTHPEQASASPEPDSLAEQDSAVTLKSLDDLAVEVDRAAQQAMSAERSLRETSGRILKVSHESSVQEQHRMSLAMHRTVMEENLARRRDGLSDQEQQEFEVQKQLFEAKLDLDKLSKQQMGLILSPGEIKEIEVEPTPVARRVDEDAVHLRIKDGLVCRVPLYELMEAVQYEQATIQRQLSNDGNVNLTVGPIAGFRMKLKTKKLASSRALTGPRVGSNSQGDQFIPHYVFQPVSKVLGDPVSQALLPGSSLQNLLRDSRKQSSVVVVWVYNDSFDEFRELKKGLKSLGFAIATKALPVGAPIVASPLGSSAHAQ